MRNTVSEVGFQSEDPGRIPGWVIDTHRPCPACSYDVIGMTIGKPCPECGKPIFFGLQAGPSFVLADEPYWYLRLMQAALWLLFIAPIGAGVVYVVQGLQGIFMPIAMGGVASLWVGTLTLLAIPRPLNRDDQAEPPQINGWLRLAAVGSQSLWLVAVVLMMISNTMAWALIAAKITALAAGVGVIFVMLLVSEVAEFAGDFNRRQRLIFLAIAMVVLIGLAAAGGSGGGATIVSFLLVGAGLVTLWNFFQLAIVGNWAVVVAQREDDRVKNMRDQFSQEHAVGVIAKDNEAFGGPVQKPLGSMMEFKRKHP